MKSTSITYIAENQVLRAEKNPFSREMEMAQMWLSVDPLAEERSWLSPYNYVQNNPLNRIDPTGMIDEPPSEKEKYEGQQHYDPDTGETWEWDGENAWHSDLAGIHKLDEVVFKNFHTKSDKSKDISSVDVVVSGYVNYRSHTQYNEFLELWRGKNGKIYHGLKGQGPNRYTGSRGFAKSKAAKIGIGGNVLGGLGIYATYSEYKYNISNIPGPNLKKYLENKHIRDQSFNAAGFLGIFGASTSFGYNLGYLIEDMCNCNIQLNPYTKDFTPIEQTLTEYDNAGINLYKK